MAAKAELTSGSATAATEHTEELQQTVRKRNATPTPQSLDDVVLKLSSDCDESAAALRNAVQTLQTGGQAEIRKLCRPWGVRLTEKKINGKYSPRSYIVLKSKLEDTLIEEAKKHFRAKGQGSISSKRQSVLKVTPTRPATEQTPEIPADAEATMQEGPPRKKPKYGCDDKLDNYFKPRAAGDALPDIEELPIPDVHTDVSSTYFRLHAQRLSEEELAAAFEEVDFTTMETDMIDASPTETNCSSTPLLHGS